LLSSFAGETIIAVARDRRFIFIASAITLGAIALIIGITFVARERNWGDNILVVVKNSDGTGITDVKAFVGGEWLALGTIGPGETRRGHVVPVADSSVTITYRDSAGAEHSVNIDTYVTGSYAGRLDAEIKAGKLASWRENFRVGPF
jgi:hypothetical protein